MCKNCVSNRNEFILQACSLLHSSMERAGVQVRRESPPGVAKNIFPLKGATLHQKKKKNWQKAHSMELNTGE